MSLWRPRQSIRVIAIGLNWRERRLLAAEVLDDVGRVKGVRPLGGGVEFGESWQQALEREFYEELGTAIRICGEALVMESIFQHQGVQGHEVVFAAEVAFPEGAFAGQDEILFSEGNGVICKARWFDLEALDSGGLALYPSGLKALLTRD
jgi:8-oxo-dGTP pyrophosphatase MutT (NUDIX family)